MWAKIHKAGDTSLVLSDWDDGLEPWHFDIWGGEFREEARPGHGFADRGVYRLGDPVYARATFRVQSGEGLELPRGEATWKLYDPDDGEVANGSGSLDARGGLSIEAKLPAEGALGTYRIEVFASGDGWTSASSIYVPAKAYRPPAFRVQVAAPEAAVVGQRIQATASARYLFGAPMKKAKVSWAAWTEDASFAPEGFEGWSFGPEYHWWEEDQPERGRATLGSETGEVRDGTTSFSQTVEPGFRQGPVDLFLEASVTDVDNQVIASASTTRVHPAAFYVGLKATDRLPQAGKAATVQVLAVSPGGEKRVESVEVKVSRRKWDSVRERGMDGQWRWVNTVDDTEVSHSTVSTGLQPVEATFTPAEPGYYVVTATGKDAQGNEALSEYGVYVVGKGYVGWGRRDDNQMELVPEKKVWKAGETARILVKAPAEKLNALVTVEREGVLWKKAVTLDGTAATVEIPITAAYRPNVFVSVVAVQGAGPQDAPDKGRPQVFVGMTELKVDAKGQHLDVAIAPSAEVYRPRDEVEVSIAVKREGAPLPGAGVTLYAVDEAILSLTNYRTPDAFDTFYADRGLSVLTADGRVVVVDRAAFLTKGANRGGGGGIAESGPEVRNKFVTTVTWQDLKTGPDGTVKAKFTLPDNLTTFRIMAVADGDAGSFGAGEKEVRVTRPLIVRPALPRILRQGDKAFAGVVVHNGADRDRWVRVAAEVTGPLGLEGSPADVKVPAGGSVEVPFSLTAQELGQAKLTFTATSGNDRDAVEAPLAIEREVPLDTVASSGRVEPGKAVTEQIARPDGAYDGWGGLTVDVSTTALVGAGSGLHYLRSYPHECAEQLTSRTLGNLMAMRVWERAGLADTLGGATEASVKADVVAGLGRLLACRAPGGGLGYWQGSPWSSTMATAYGVELLGRAEQAGLDVDDKLLGDLVGYLRDVISDRARRPAYWDDEQVMLVEKAYIASALARAEAGDAGLNNQLFAQRKQLSVFGTASLLEAIARTTGTDARTDELARTVASRSFVEPTEASVKEADASRWARLWGSDDLATAAALEALVVAKSDSPLLPKYAVHLAGSKVGERWANTRATAGVLAALAAYAERFEAADGGKITPAVAIAGKAMLSKALTVPDTASETIPMSKLPNGPLSIDAKGGPLYYEARLTYAKKDPPARDEGFAVQRAFEVVDGAGVAGRVVEGTMLRVTLTVVTPVGRHDVAVRDPIPAGLEPVDTSLATASRAPTGDDEAMDALGYADDDSYEQRTDELPEYGGSWVFDHYELDDAEVRLYATDMPAGVHTFRYLVRATTPGTFAQPAATAEEMYEPENFGRTKVGTLTIGGGTP
ncbi:MAG: alpha-2-macroglobulin family protein [Myxococcota bacterium]